jgi:dihydropteroate synthase
VPLDEELRRILPVIEQLTRRSPVLVSVDTSKAEVARRSIEAGAHIINDVTAFRDDPAMAAIARESNAGLVIMHMQGTPKTMQLAPAYRDVSAEVGEFLAERLGWLETQGIQTDRVAIDPGIGFGKLFEHNMTLVRELGRLAGLNRPICFGASRKGFLGDITDRPRDRRDAATAAISLAAYMRGASILRVHEVADTRDVITVMRAVGT